MSEQLEPSPPVVLHSRIDASVNFVEEATVGFVEARYVRRLPEYFIAYLSAQTGCAKGCRFCHLTQTAQTASVDVAFEGLLDQADSVLTYYDSLGDPAEVVHFNFMARGEALASEVLLHRGDEVCAALAERAARRQLTPVVKISTIVPRELAGTALLDLFPLERPDFYYSLYSMDEAFRRRWLPKAAPAAEGLAMLADWQRSTGMVPVLHWAFIEGENDSLATIDGICQGAADAGLRAYVNIVRYNPYSPRQGREPAEAVIARNVERLRSWFGDEAVKVVPRVGTDVAASCGMFVAGRRPVIDLAHVENLI